MGQEVCFCYCYPEPTIFELSLKRRSLDLFCSKGNSFVELVTLVRVESFSCSRQR